MLATRVGFISRFSMRNVVVWFGAYGWNSERGWPNWAIDKSYCNTKTWRSHTW